KSQTLLDGATIGRKDALDFEIPEKHGNDHLHFQECEIASRAQTRPGPKRHRNTARRVRIRSRCSVRLKPTLWIEDVRFGKMAFIGGRAPKQKEQSGIFRHAYARDHRCALRLQKENRRHWL